MTDNAYLTIIISLVYLSECLFLLKKESVVIYAPFLNRMKFAFAEALPSTRGEHLFLCNPVPPFGMNFSANFPSVAFSSKGISIIGEVDITLSYNDIRAVDFSGKTVSINGKKILSAVSPLYAKFVAGTISHLLTINDNAREKHILDMIDDAFDVDSISRKFDTFRKFAYRLIIINSVIFVLIFIILPLMLYFDLALRQYGKYLSVLLISLIINFYFYSKIHCCFFKEEREERWTTIIIMFFSPLLAIRSHDFIAKNLLWRYHPAAVGSVLLDDKIRNVFCGRIVRDLMFPIGKEGRNKIISWFNEQLLAQIAACLSRDYLSVDDLLKAPMPEDASIRTYCPRCLCQFTAAGGLCTDCGIELKSIMRGK